MGKKKTRNKIKEQKMEEQDLSSSTGSEFWKTEDFEYSEGEPSPSTMVERGLNREYKLEAEIEELKRKIVEIEKKAKEIEKQAKAAEERNDRELTLLYHERLKTLDD